MRDIFHDIEQDKKKWILQYVHPSDEQLNCEREREKELADERQQTSP